MFLSDVTVLLSSPTMILVRINTEFIGTRKKISEHTLAVYSTFLKAKLSHAGNLFLHFTVL